MDPGKEVRRQSGEQQEDRMKLRIRTQPVRDARTGKTTVRRVWRLDPRVGHSRIKAKAPVRYAKISKAIAKAKADAAEKVRKAALKAAGKEVAGT